MSKLLVKLFLLLVLVMHMIAGGGSDDDTCADETSVTLTPPDLSTDNLILLETGSTGSEEMDAFEIDGGVCTTGDIVYTTSGAATVLTVVRNDADNAKPIKYDVANDNTLSNG